MEPLALPTQTKPPFPQSGRRHVRENRAIGTGLAAPIDRRKFPRAIGRRRDFARALSAILTLSERKTRAWNTARERPNQGPRAGCRSAPINKRSNINTNAGSVRILTSPPRPVSRGKEGGGGLFPESRPGR